jgi:hypothetical protein
MLGSHEERLGFDQMFGFPLKSVAGGPLMAEGRDINYFAQQSCP